MGEGYAVIQMARSACSGGGVSLVSVTHSAAADSATTQSTAFKYVMAFEPYRYTLK
jgi:hypothetical protein